MTEVDPRSPVAVEAGLTGQVQAITEAQNARLITAWALAFSEVNADLTDALREVLGAGGTFTAGQLRRSRRLAQTLDRIAERLEGLTSQTGVVFSRDARDVITRGFDSQATLITSQLQPGRRLPGFEPDLGPSLRQLDAIIARSTEQITSLLKPVAPDTEDAIRRELIRGVAAGSHPRATARRMVARVNNRAELGRQRAEVIARTETVDAYREGARAGERTHSKVLAGWVWLTHLSPRTCPSCLARNGTFHDLDEPGPQDHPQGRCARMPVVRRPDGSVNTSFVPDAQAYFDGLPETDKVAVMGRRRLALYQSGAVDLADMSTRRTSSAWRPSWQVTPVRELQRRADAASPAA